MRALLTCFLTLFVSTAMCQPAQTQTIDFIFADYTGSHTPGAAVLVVRDGKVLFEKGYGMADISRQVPCSLDTNFRLASVTKQFTAMAILMLAEEGQLSLEDKLSKWFPDFPAHGDKITIKHLLTHTSGLKDYEDHMPVGLKIPLSDRDVLHIVRQQQDLYFPPGSDFRYSNSGYAILALLVEIVSGETFPAYLKMHIFQPLGMDHSVAYVSGISSVANRAYGYALEDGKWIESDQSLTSAVLGDGGVYSSVRDLLKWNEALYTEQLLPRKRLEEAFTLHSKKSDFEESGYGYGWYVGSHRGSRSLWHYGSTCGFRTHISRFPEKKLSIIVLTNRREPALDNIVKQLTSLFWEAK